MYCEPFWLIQKCTAFLDLRKTFRLYRIDVSVNNMQSMRWINNPCSNLAVARRIKDARISVLSNLLAFMLCAIYEETSGYFILLVNLQLYVSQEALLMKLQYEQ